MRIFQILGSLVLGDAIGNNTLLLNEMFLGTGIDSKIFAINIGPELSNIHNYNSLPTLSADDIVLYHMSDTSKINSDLLSMPGKKIAIYHNTTPSHFFSRFDNAVSKRQFTALNEMRSLSNCFDWCIADSTYNKECLVKLGYSKEKITVIPILLDFDDYRKAPDKKTLAKYSDGYTNILFTGRVAPNKKHEDIIRIFAWYKKNINPTSRLILIGSQYFTTYMNSLNEYVRILNLTDVIFLGHISFPEILAFYSLADIFLCMSEHEGFCVPLIEAMLFDVPIIAYDSTAIPETLGGSGILVDEKDPVLISKIINRIMTDSTLKDDLISSQQQRLLHYNNDSIFKQILDIVNMVAGT